MPLASAAFRYPVRFAATSYVLRVEATVGGASNLTFPASGSLSPTTDYFFSGDGSSTDLIELIRACVDSHGSLSGTTATLDASHKLSISVSGNTFQLLWANAATTLDPVIFGFIDGSDSLETNPVVSPNVPMGLLYLDMADGVERPVSVDSRPRQPVVGGISRSISGLTRASRFALPSKERSLTVNLVHESLALDEYAPSDAPYSTFESMHIRASSLGYPIHFLPDDTDDGTYSVLRLAPPLVDNLKRDSQYPLRWSWNADFIVDSSVASYTSQYSYFMNDAVATDGLNMGDVAQFDGATRVTWSWWQYNDEAAWSGDNTGIWSKFTGTQGCYDIRRISTSRIIVNICPTLTSGATGTTPNDTFTTRVWQHVMVVYDGTLSGNANRLVIYLDGVVTGALTFAGTIPASLTSGSTSNMLIGLPSSASSNNFPGNLDELACWVGTAASSAQVLELYNSGTPNDVSATTLGDPTFWYRADGDTLPTATDHGSAGVNGTAAGGLILSTEVPP